MSSSFDSHDSPRARAQTLAARFAETAVERDARGGTAKTERDALRQSGLLTLTTPRELGGEGCGWDTLLEVVTDLARADPSVAHVFAFHHLMLATVRLFGSEAQATRTYRDSAAGRWFWGNALNPHDPRTRLTKRGDGYVLDGVKSFCSGALDSDALIVSALEEGSGRLRIVAIPSHRAGIAMLNDWDAIGQRQTDSGTVTFDGVRVDDDEILRTPGPLGSVYASLRPCLAQAILVHIYLGIGEGAFAAARARVQASEAERARATDPFTQLRWGEMHVDLAAAGALAQRARTALATALGRGEGLTARERGETAVAIATAKVQATRAGLDVAERIFQVLGARATSRRDALDRYWRNLRTHTLHDPVDHKLKELGAHAVLDQLPEPGFYS